MESNGPSISDLRHITSETRPTGRPVLPRETRASTTRNSRALRARGWCFTVNNWTSDDLAIIRSLCRRAVTEFGYQTEVGDDGTPHIQGYLLFKNTRTLSAVSKDLPRAHLEQIKNLAATRNYCEKADSWDGKIRCSSVPSSSPTKKNLLRATLDPLDGKEYYEWQQMILDIIDAKPHDRHIHWFWEPDGAAGKTSFAKHLVMTRPGTLYIAGKASDCLFGIASYISSTGLQPKIIIYDVARSSKIGDPEMYLTVEKVKDAIFFVTKYESCMVTYDTCHVIFFANELPFTSYLSKDRWQIHDIREHAYPSWIHEETDSPIVTEVPETPEIQTCQQRVTRFTFPSRESSDDSMDMDELV